jgi:hypothetical protein
MNNLEDIMITEIEVHIRVLDMGAIRVMYLPCYWKIDPLFKMQCYMHAYKSFTSHSTV